MGKQSLEGEKLYEILAEQIELVGMLSEAWQSFDSEKITSAEFERLFESVISNFETWVSGFLKC